MACVNPDGTLSPSALSILKALQGGAKPAAELAQLAGLPVYRVRSSMRELVGAGLVAEQDETYRLTEAGAAQIAQ
jgi:DNA-binding IclR family transcriptional regulator